MHDCAEKDGWPPDVAGGEGRVSLDRRRFLSAGLGAAGAALASGASAPATAAGSDAAQRASAGKRNVLSTRFMQALPRRVLLSTLVKQHPGLRRDRRSVG